MLNLFIRCIKNSSIALMSLIFTGLTVCGGFYLYILICLPDVRQLKDKSIQIPLRIYSSDGKLISEFGEKKRIPVILEQVPKLLIQAILDTEDQRFYEHSGVDFLGLVRAGIVFLISGKKSQGASTITMQVARDFFLNRQKTFNRKFNEILLAFKIDRSFNKNEILELYLNKIYFGNRAYGVAAAAQIYYGKSLNELTIAETATIAGLPQAPSRSNPIINPKSARERRNHVLLRMLESNHIKQAEYKTAIASPIVTNYHEPQIEVSAPYVAEIIRNIIIARYGNTAYEIGVKVYTTIDSRIQSIANSSLRDGILAYDERHGYRGPEGKLAPNDKRYWGYQLQNMSIINDLEPAVVFNINKIMSVLLTSGKIIDIDSNNFRWTQYNFTCGDIVRIRKTINGQWRLTQLPKIEGALVALNPKNGAVLALSGGFSYATSNYNRAIQAERQTGSAFKPFIYSAALAKGLTLASIINDAPVVLEDLQTKTLWRPQNDSQTFYGPTNLRTALIYSRNLVSVRLLQNIGIPYAVDYLKKFGFEGRKEAPPTLSLSLGAGVVTPLKMATGYAVFANGGYKVIPFFINSIIESNNREDKVVFEAKTSFCSQVITTQNAYLITDVLKDVIRHGTAKNAKILNRNDLAGKTGTTNEKIDAWFSGFNNSLVATVWIGFDQPQTIHEHGGQAALPIWIQFMHEALDNQPLSNLKRPNDIVSVRIDPLTGLLSNPEQPDAVFEIFALDNIPQIIAQEQSQTTGNALNQTNDVTPLF
jgi:penicillin-binding protein 1A